MHARPWILEGSFTPIYERIVQGLAEGLRGEGADVWVVDPRETDLPAHLGLLRRHPDAVVLSSASNSRIERLTVDGRRRWFECVENPVVFLHHNAILTEGELPTAIARLRAFQRQAHRSAHLCLEPSNARGLVASGIARADAVGHACEFEPADPWDGPFEWPVSFVGHVLPSGTPPQDSKGPIGQLAAALAELRLRDPAVDLEPLIAGQARASVGDEAEGAEHAALCLATAQWIRHHVHQHSLRVRGAWLEQAALPELHVFGGDPGPLNGVAQTRFVQAPGLVLHPQVFDTAAVADIYRRSAVSLNITALQFDEAVVNRVHDVFTAGGLCLTDRRSGLASFTSMHREIGYSSVEELNERAAYFADPSHRAHRAEVIRQVQSELLGQGGYRGVARQMTELAQSF